MPCSARECLASGCGSGAHAMFSLYCIANFSLNSLRWWEVSPFLFHPAIQRTLESQEEGHVKTVKRTIEEVAVEAPPTASPLKIQKAPAEEPSAVEAPSVPQAPPPEPILKEEAEVRQPPGKLKKDVASSTDRLRESCSQN